MIATQRSTIDQRTVTWGIDDGEIRPTPYSSVGRRYRVDRLIVRFSRFDGVVFRVTSAELKGRALKRDGSDSKNRASEHLWASDGYPDWVQDLINQELFEKHQADAIISAATDARAAVAQGYGEDA